MQKNQTKGLEVALITGSGRRIGAEIARQLHADGINIIVHYHHSKTAAHELCSEFNQTRENSAVALQADVCDIANLGNVIQSAVAIWGRLDFLINNASCFYQSPMGHVSENQWDDLITTNLKAPFFLSQAAAPYLAKVKGSIINIGDIHGERPMRNYSVYCISKAGLLMLNKSLAKELAPAVRVNAVLPGPLLWPEGDNALSLDEQQRLIDRTLLKKAGGADDIAKAVLFYLRTDFITGQALMIDGGRSLKI